MLGSSSCSKGSRSSSRQTKKSASSTAKDCRKLLNLNLSTADMPVCESEKPGVSVLGCHFTERAENLPIKKRRYVHRSQSPPPKVSRGDGLLGSSSLELTSFINSNLTWKASKGNRSSSRQTKKPVSTTMKDCRKLLNLNLKAVDMPVHASEKLEVSVRGCRLSEKAEHVPIKKRRLINRSPSLPPSVLSPHSQEAEIVSKTSARVITCTTSANDCDVDKENTEKTKAQVDEHDDFSGMSILAATACCMSFGGEDGHADGDSGREEPFVREGSSEHSRNNDNAETCPEISRGLGSCFSSLPAENAVACVKTVNSSTTDIFHRNKSEGASKQDQPVASEDISTSKDEETVRKQEVSSRDCRLHWDLNREIDSWEPPFDNQIVDANGVDGFAEDMGGQCSDIGDADSYELQTGIGDSKTVVDQKQLSGDSGEAHECNQLQPNILSSELHLSMEVDEFEEGKKPSYNQERISTDVEPFLVPANDAPRHSAPINEDQSSSDRNGSVTGTIGDDYLSLHGIVRLSSCVANSIPSNSSCHTSSCASDEYMSISSDSPVEEKEVSPVVALSINTAKDKAVSGAMEVSRALDDTNNLLDIVALDTGQPLKTEHLDNVNEDYFSSVHLDVEMHTSTTLVEYQGALKSKMQDEKASVHDSAETDTSILINGEDAATKCSEKSAELVQGPCVHNFHSCDDLVNSYDKVTLDEPSDYYSDVSHDHVKSHEREVDYDSQYEDGEVRESIIHAWEDYDCEDMDVAYGSDNANHMTCGSLKTAKCAQETNFHQAYLSGSSGPHEEKPSEGKKGKSEFECGDEGPGKVTGDDLDNKEDDIEQKSLSADSIIKLARGCDLETFADSVPVVGGGSSRMNLDDCMDILAIEGAKTRMVGAREFRRTLRSHIEGRGSKDGYVKEKPYMQRTSDTHNSNPRSVKEPGYVESFGRVRYQAHIRGEEEDHWVNSDRGFKCYRSSNYYGPPSFRCPGPENGSVGRRKMDASSLNVHRRFRRTGSLVDRDEAFRLRLGFRPYRELSANRDEAFRLGFRPSRELSPDRCMSLGRGRSLRCGPRLDKRGARGRYHGPDDSPGPFFNSSHPPFNRERILSPSERRGEDTAQKSPNFRSEVKMQRGRSPYRWSSFVNDRVVGFRKMHRNHGSPRHHNSTCVGDWKEGVVNFKEQVRFGPRDEMFDLVDTPRNYRSMHAGKFLEMEGVGRGRPRCNRNDDTREKHGHGFGLAPPVKRFGVDGPVKRLHYNVDEGFIKTRNSRYEDAPDSYGRGGHSKHFGRGIGRSIGDGQRRFRDERVPFIDIDGKLHENEKSFGVRESDGESASSRRS